ncbi:MAG TPA: hypothetical protein VLF88_00470 [Candidatus Babeliales bacterium]|nr:hypothetical protein [Candidatus Babeliales bacterium]
MPNAVRQTVESISEGLDEQKKKSVQKWAGIAIMGGVVEISSVSLDSKYAAVVGGIAFVSGSLRACWIAAERPLSQAEISAETEILSAETENFKLRQLPEEEKPAILPVPQSVVFE